MKTIWNPQRKDWNEILSRPAIDDSALSGMVNMVLDDVRLRGDQALFEYEVVFDKVQLKSLQVTEEEIQFAEKSVSSELKAAIEVARKNIETFHLSQQIEVKKIETMPGVVCWQKSVGIEKVGLYVPGGTAPLFSTVLMLGIPAKIAGCDEIVLCTPPNKEGNINPVILYAAKVAGIHKIFKLGGVQAIAAMAYGTDIVPKVYKIFGPGNQYVTAAKRMVSLKDVAIDMPAGPSEVLIIADDTANPAFVTADLLSQAEHGGDSQVILITTSRRLIDKVLREIIAQLSFLTRRDIAAKTLENSKVILLKDNEEIIDFTNAYAPEHLIIETEDYWELSEQIVNAGSVFLGHYTPESAGDYASGTNHTLPTNGYARVYGGVNLDSFVKKITFQEISRRGIGNLGKTLEIMAENEGLTAHKNAVSLRLKN